jgi:hypothetical protein
METNLSQRFMALFEGYEKAHGRFEIQYREENGKVKGKANTVHSAATLHDVELHLEGKVGLGTIALKDNNTLLFAVIDVDVYNIDHTELEKKIARLPLVICRSKSGGAHLCVFFSEPVAAGVAIEKLSEWAAYLGYGGVELFPKQTTRVEDGKRKDTGNWINLPYFESESTQRYAIKDGKRLSLIEFLDYAESKRVSLKDLASINLVEETDERLFINGPPCLRYLASFGGFPEGTRNDGMYNAAVYLKKRHPDNWEDKLQEYNVKLCDPPLTLKEINELSRSVSRKDYNYKCKQAPIAPHCVRRKCVTQEFGIANGVTDSSESVDIVSITKYEGEPVLWVLEIDGVRIQMDTETLLSQTAFNRRCADKINRIPGSMPKMKWEKYLDEKIRHADVVPVPEDAGHTGQFLGLLEQFCNSSVQARAKDELLLNKPWRDGGKVYFKSRGLIEYLDNHRFRYESEHHLWQMLREKGAEKGFFNIKGKGCNVWVIPEPDMPDDHPAPIPDFGTEVF